MRYGRQRRARRLLKFTCSFAAPWTVALLLGRTLNTIRVSLYEWEDGPDDCGSLIAPRYLHSLVVRSGAGGSPIERVVIPMRREALA